LISNVRVRYAPSPTGEPHLGNIRTAIFNWLFARHNAGSFILRIEDTDKARHEKGAIESILNSLRWLGIDWDEGPGLDGGVGPYLQSQRLPLYHSIIEILLQEGNAYLCYCSPKRLEEMRQSQMINKEAIRYDRLCREVSRSEIIASPGDGQDTDSIPVVRFKSPLDGKIKFHDLIRGVVSFDCSLLDDFVILKSDGYPTYHLANVVDDHAMNISHVLRAEEWLSSTPRHLLLYQALGYSLPIFAHLPMILGPDRSKLSKRHGATSMLAYREMGYLPEAMLNFLTLLGWSLDDHTEIISRMDLISNFSLERIGMSGAIFNQEKLTWMNGIYIRNLKTEELAEAILPILEQDLPAQVPRPLDWSYLLEIVPLIQERIKILGEAPEMTGFFFMPQVDNRDSGLINTDIDSTKAHGALSMVINSLLDVNIFESTVLERQIRLVAENLELKAGHLFKIIRLAVTGSSVSPPLFQTMAVLGRGRCIDRLRSAKTAIDQSRSH
jgi:glutamyl-tRNA synthetase